MPAVDFDFALIAAPFRMQPGLRRLPDDARHLTPLDAGSAPCTARRSRWCEAGRSAAGGAGLRCGARRWPRSRGKRRAKGWRSPPTPPSNSPARRTSRSSTAPRGTLPWLCVCVPSHWAPGGQAGPGLPRRARAGGRQRHAAGRQPRNWCSWPPRASAGSGIVWTVSPAGRHDQHPRRHPRTPWPEASRPAGFRGQLLPARRAPDLLPGRAGHAAGRVHHPRHAAAARGGGRHPGQGARACTTSLASMSDAVLALQGPRAARASRCCAGWQGQPLMELLLRIAQVIVPVFFIVAHGLRLRPPRAARPHGLQPHRAGRAGAAAGLHGAGRPATSACSDHRRAARRGGALLILAAGVAAWVLARRSRAQPRTLVPVVMFNNSRQHGPAARPAGVRPGAVRRRRRPVLGQQPDPLLARRAHHQRACAHARPAAQPADGVRGASASPAPRPACARRTC